MRTWSSALCVIVVIGICRCVPHIANFSPLIGGLVLAAQWRPRWLLTSCLLLSLMISDGVLAFINHTSMFGAWTVWTYTGFLVVLLTAQRVPRVGQYQLRTLGVGLSASIGFWGWTNLGVWLTSGMYPLSQAGLVQCYTAALPFLQHTVTATLVTIALWFGVQSLVGLPEGRPITVSSKNRKPFFR